MSLLLGERFCTPYAGSEYRDDSQDEQQAEPPRRLRVSDLIALFIDNAPPDAAQDPRAPDQAHTNHR
jgi:hypothetical protein